MKSIAIVYHSASGRTERIARTIASGASLVPGCDVHLLRAQELIERPQALLAYHGLILGSPTYLGGVSAPLKALMDATGPLWRQQKLRGRLAAGFTVSALPAGDKQSTLISLFTFCMQHGMLWAGNPILPEQHLGVPVEDAANRLGSWSGLMAQADKTAADFCPGDLKTARMFGQHFAETLSHLHQPQFESAQETHA
ncbi:multimeric flavodoxin WrbA [Pseudomonas nitritireducens]|uniref:Multimeric flavodoxin WrbA n=1 Tax=Pseudomonas nitroreducens TaxID=46680 RepID=A0A7W7KQA8_PSENT|nr:flavodoxin family protein [Pseudomonas nitritireducens]MBB4867025.1 multimeric flavodoxin WrbA [Pseudomonas nitritireducens]